MISFGDVATVAGRPTRRTLLRLGLPAFGGLGAGWSAAAHGEAAAVLRDRAVIFLFMHGGPAQQETFDPKPDAPAGIRSLTGAISTTVPGLHFGGTFTNLARRAHLLTVIRSFVTGDGNHDVKPVVGPASGRATLGALYSRVAGPLRPESALPTSAVLFPTAVDPQAGPPIGDFGNLAATGDLGSGSAPFVPGSGPFQEDLRLHLAPERLGDRRGLLDALDRGRRWADGEGLRGGDRLRASAFQTLLGDAVAAFDLAREDAAVVDRYDTASRFNVARIDPRWKNHRHYVDHGRSLGRLLLLARRLAERGCGVVTVTTSFVWDMHADVNNAPMDVGMDYVGAPFDHAVATLIDDLESRGLRDRVLLVCCGEMGRTPQVNGGGGRDHWGGLAPLLLYGGGYAGGQVIGRSSRDGGSPASDPVTIPDLVATVLDTVIDPARVRLIEGLPRQVHDALGRGRAIPGRS